MNLISELCLAAAIWYFRGFEYARNIEEKAAIDKDVEYEGKLKSLLDDSRNGWNELRKRHLNKIMRHMLLDKKCVQEEPLAYFCPTGYISFFANATFSAFEFIDFVN